VPEFAGKRSTTEALCRHILDRLHEVRRHLVFGFGERLVNKLIGLVFEQI